MPANKKYLTTSPIQRAAKITAGILGGYVIAALFQMCISLLLPYPKEVLITGIFIVFPIWCVLLIIPFLFKNGWKAWGLYLAIIIILYMIFSIAVKNNPFI